MRADGYHLIDAEMVDARPRRRADDRRRRRRASRSADRSPTACRPVDEQPRRPGARRSSAAPPPCTSTSGSPTVVGSVAGRPTPPPCCAGPASTTSRRRVAARRRRAVLPRRRAGPRDRHRRGRRAAAVRAAGVTLVVPPFGVSTPAVYRAWDELGGPTADGPNDLEPAALAVEPRSAGGATASPSSPARRRRWPGSGATWFVRASATTPSPPCGARALGIVVREEPDALP